MVDVQPDLVSSLTRSDPTIMSPLRLLWANQVCDCAPARSPLNLDDDLETHKHTNTHAYRERERKGTTEMPASRSTRDDATNARRIVLNSWYLERQPVEESGSAALACEKRQQHTARDPGWIAFRGYSSHFPPSIFRGNRMEVEEPSMEGGRGRHHLHAVRGHLERNLLVEYSSFERVWSLLRRIISVQLRGYVTAVLRVFEDPGLPVVALSFPAGREFRAFGNLG